MPISWIVSGGQLSFMNHGGGTHNFPECYNSYYQISIPMKLFEKKKCNGHFFGAVTQTMLKNCLTSD